MAHVTVHIKISAEFDTDCDAVDEESALDDIVDNERLADKLLTVCYENMSIIAGSYDEEEPEDDEDFEDVEDFEEDEDITKPEVKKEENK